MDESTRTDQHPVETVDLHWARRQRLLAVVGAVIALAGLLTAARGLADLAVESADARPYAIAAVAGSAVLFACCAVIAVCWFVQLPDWRSGGPALPNRRAGGPALPNRRAGGPATAGERLRTRMSLIAHITGYVAVLVTMYGALAASALAYWDSLAGSLLGISFILAIFGQIIGGTQLLRRSGPPGTIPAYLRQLNAKVQSLR